jgi:hypothetical protein
MVVVDGDPSHIRSLVPEPTPAPLAKVARSIKCCCWRMVRDDHNDCLGH